MVSFGPICPQPQGTRAPPIGNDKVERLFGHHAAPITRRGGGQQRAEES